MQLKTLKRLFVLLQFSLILIFIFAVAINGYSNLAYSDSWIIYSITIVLTLPSLISKNIFKSSFFGLLTSLSFLIYSIIYIIIFASSKIFSTITISNMAFLLFILIIIFWNVLLLFTIVNYQTNKPKLLSKRLLKFSLLFLISLFIFLFLKQSGSILALDYLQHQSVVNKMIIGEKLCLIPDTCSNLFLKTGYTTIYHSIIAMFGSFAQNSIVRVYYLIDLIWLTLNLILVYKIFFKVFRKSILSLIGSILVAYVFTNGAYEFSFFLPQTLAFFIFLNLISIPKLSLLKVLIAIILMTSIHFVMGPFLGVILLIKYLLIDKILKESREVYLYDFLPKIGFIFIIFTIVLNLSGFSIEQYFQKEDVKIIGGTTNLMYPQNILFILSILGFGSLIFIISLLYFFKDKQKSKYVLFAFLYIELCIGIYLLSPTYANKFLIGFGIFSSIIVLNYLKDLKNKYNNLIMTSIVCIYLLNFTTNFQNYKNFYRQENNTTSILVKEDNAILSYLNNNNQNFNYKDCLIISDPYTQIIISGLTNFDTARAQYMLPLSRRALFDFVSSPSDATFDNLLKIDELAKFKGKVCLLFTSRLEETLKLDNSLWLSNIYNYLINNNYKISEAADLTTYMIKKKAPIIFINDNFILYSPLSI